MVRLRAAKSHIHRRPFLAAALAIGLVLPAPAWPQTQPADQAGASAPATSVPTPPAAAAPTVPSVNPPASAAPTAPAQPPESASPVAPTLPTTGAMLSLPRDLSPWGMFMAADIVVKTVMVGLAFASVLTWTIWFAKAIELLRSAGAMQAAIEELARHVPGTKPLHHKGPRWRVGRPGPGRRCRTTIVRGCALAVRRKGAHCLAS